MVDSNELELQLKDSNSNDCYMGDPFSVIVRHIFQKSIRVSIRVSKGR